MKKIRFPWKICISLIAWAMLILSLSGCGAKGEEPKVTGGEESAQQELSEQIPTETVTETEELEPIVPPELDEGIITYFSGDVFILDGGEWWDIEIGETLAREDSIKTEASSYCEIQFGETAVVRIQENTEITVSDLGLKIGEARVGLELDRGSVLCKVQKLGGSERFKVRTQTAVCGVRGTEFSISSLPGGDTRLAVKEGAVSVLPASVDIDRLKEQASGRGKAVEELLDEIELSAPVVEADEEIDLDENLLRDTGETGREIEKVVRELAAAGDEQQVAEKVANLQKAVERTKQEVAQRVNPPKRLSAESRRSLEEIDTIRVLEIAPRGSEETGSSDMPPQPALIPLSVSVQPKDAVIELNGERVGTGSFSGIYPEGQNLSFRLSAPGYRENVLQVLTGADSSKAYTVKLGRLPEGRAEPEAAAQKKAEAEPEAEQETETVAVTEKTAARERIEVKAVPGDAQIYLDGKLLGKGSYTEEFEHGETLAFVIRKEGFEEQTMNLTIEEGAGRTYEVSLTKLPEEIKVRSVTVEASPSDAVISIDGSRAGSGRVSRQFEESSKIIISVERKGYEPKTLNVTVGEGRDTHSVRLEAKTVQTDVRITDAPLVGRVASGAGRIYAADRAGRLIAANFDGDVQWKIETANTPNENSYPVLIGSRVYFSGSKELVIANAANGEISARVPLEGASAHLFGRRVVPYLGDILFPTNGSIQIRDGRTGKVKHEVEIPNGSRMTPAVWGETVVIANQQGALLILDPYSDTPIVGNVPTGAVQPVALGVTVWADRAFFSGRKGTVVCVDLSAQEVLWERKLPGDAPVFSDITCDGRGLYAFSKGTLYALSVEDGRNLYPHTPDATSPAECGGNRFFYGTGNSLAVANAGTGEELRRIPVPGRVVTGPAAEGSKIIVGTENGRLLVINP